MKRYFDNLLIDLVAATLMIGMAATGYILRFPLPPGSNKYLALWGLTRHQWGDVHFWISLALLGVVLLHLGLHWQWIVVSVKRKWSVTKAASGSVLYSGLATVLILGVVLVLFGWAAHHGVEQITEPREEACSTPDSGGPRKTAAAGDSHSATTIAFWENVYPILERSCLSCHGPKKQRGDFRADLREDFFSPAGGKAPLIVPGKSEESRLIGIVSGQDKNIPRPDVHRLPVEQVDLLQRWINAGAYWPERPSDPK